MKLSNIGLFILFTVVLLAGQTGCDNLNKAMEKAFSDMVPKLTPMDHTCLTTSNGGVKCWGKNNKGQLGNGTTDSSTISVSVEGLNEEVFSAITGHKTSFLSFYSAQSCALFKSGKVACWGYLPGTSDSYTIPKYIDELQDAAQISGSYGHICAVLKNGRVMCWGHNEHGALGNGSSADYGYPVMADTLAGLASWVATGDQFTCAVMRDNGTVSCWGNNQYGTLGNGTVVNSYMPMQVLGIRSATQVTAGYEHACALLQSGDVKCWGNNEYGQLGDGSMRNSSIPVDVTGMGEPVASITAGRYHTCALTRGGGAKCWGSNTKGQLGDGTTRRRYSPVDVVGLDKGVVLLQAFHYNTCSRTEDGSAQCWGDNESGELGDGTTTGRAAPVDVKDF
jgi:alpha-tubulin suppressor-like RCC1 family protein